MLAWATKQTATEKMGQNTYNATIRKGHSCAARAFHTNFRTEARTIPWAAKITKVVGASRWSCLRTFGNFFSSAHQLQTTHNPVGIKTSSKILAIRSPFENSG